MSDEESEIEILTDEMMHGLEIDLITGLDNCENIIKGNDEKNKDLKFHEYLDKIQENVKRCSCYTSWSGVKTLAVKCRTCSQEAEKSDDSKGLLCLSCFLNGNHEGHDVQIVYSTYGNCCCGDSLYYKPEGFCSKHSIPDEHPELTQFDHRQRITMISATKALLKHLLYYSNYETITSNLILKWIQRLIFIGDAARRCVAIAWIQTINLFDLYQNCIHLNHEQSNLLLLIIGSLINDAAFRTYFTKSLLSNLDHYVWLNSRFTLMDLNKLKLIMNHDSNSPDDDIPLAQAVQLFTFSCLSMSKNLTSQLIRTNQINWLNISSKSLVIIHHYLFSLKDKLRSYGFLDSVQKPMLLLIDVGLKEISKANENENEDNLDPSANLNFIDQFSAFCRKSEMTFPITRQVFGDKMNDPTKLQTIVFEFYFNLFTIIQTIKNENILSDTPIFLLDDFFRNDLNSDKVDKDIPGSIFEHSVLQKGVIFSQVYPLHLLAYVCCDLTKPNSIQELSEKVYNNDVDLFLKNWILLPLRYLAACDLNQFDFFIRNDTETINVINSLRYKNNIGNNFIIIFSLIQQILFLYKDKEEILEIICHTYGLFLTSKIQPNPQSEPDNNESKLMEKQIHGRLFAFLHFICSLIFDNLCFKRDFFNMRRYATMTHLKFRMSGLNASQIDEIWPNHPMSDVKFIEDLPSFTTQITGGYSGTIYKLRNDVKWHPILPFLDTGLILQAIQDFCNKNPSSLIPFPEIPGEIELDKERTAILFQPLLYAFEYFILSTYTNFQELLQLTLNLLVITKKSLQNYDEKVNNEEKQQIVAENLLDLVNQLKGVSFNQFLNLKISLMSSKLGNSTENKGKQEQNQVNQTETSNNNNNNETQTETSNNNNNNENQTETNNNNNNNETQTETSNNNNNNETQTETNNNNNNENQTETSNNNNNNNNETQTETNNNSHNNNENQTETSNNNNNNETQTETNNNSHNNNNENQTESNNNNNNENQTQNNNNNENSTNDNDDNDNIEKEDVKVPEMKSIIDFILELDELGQSVLKELEIAIPTKSSDDNDNDKNDTEKEEESISLSSAPSSTKSNKANLLKQQILQNFKNQQKSFSDAHDVKCDQNSSNLECCVCGCSSQQDSTNVDDYLFYPCLSYKTIVPKVVETKQIMKTVSLRICMHPIHTKCVDIEVNNEEANSSDDLLKKLVHFQCPSDRCPRNCLLPIVTTEFAPIPKSNPLYQLLTCFVQSAYGLETFVVDIVRSFCAEIELLEIRARDNPTCLDSLATQTTIHLVYLAIWHTRSSEADYILEHDDDSITPLMKYILILISLGPRKEVNPHDIVHAIASEMTEMTKIIRLVVFLRCCAIFDYIARNDRKFLEEKVQQFTTTHQRNQSKHHHKRINKKVVQVQHIGKCITTQNEVNNNIEDEDDDENILKSSSSSILSSSNEQFYDNSNTNNNDSEDDDTIDSNASIDWDVVLSPEFLFYFYNIGFSSDVSKIIKENYMILFPLFDFGPLPNNFLQFMNDPFETNININLSNTIEGEIAICLFSHKYVTLPNSVNHKKTQGAFPPVSEFLKTTLKKTFSVFLVLNGPQASSVLICDLKTNKIIRIKGFYVDQFDEEDPGLKRGHILTLSQSKKKETIENILSGNWTNYRTW